MADNSQRAFRRARPVIARFAIAGGLIGLVLAFLTIDVSATAMEADVLELNVRIFEHVLHRETGPPAAIDRELRVWGWSLFGGFVAAGAIAGAGIAVTVRRATGRTEKSG